MHRDLGGGAIDVTQILRREFDFNCPDVLFQAMQSCGAWNRNDPRLLGRQPREGDLSGRRVLPLGDLGEQINECLIRLERLRREAREPSSCTCVGLLLVRLSDLVFLVADLFHPVSTLAVELLHDGDVRHSRSIRTVPLK